MKRKFKKQSFQQIFRKFGYLLKPVRKQSVCHYCDKMPFLQQGTHNLNRLPGNQGLAAGAQIDKTSSAKSFLGKGLPDFFRTMLKPRKFCFKQSLLSNIAVTAFQIACGYWNIAIQIAFNLIHSSLPNIQLIFIGVSLFAHANALGIYLKSFVSTLRKARATREQQECPPRLFRLSSSCNSNFSTMAFSCCAGA